MSILKIPPAPKSIQKGFPLKLVLDKEAIHQLGENLHSISDQFDKVDFVKNAMDGLEPLGIKERSNHIADSLRKHLPNNY